MHKIITALLFLVVFVIPLDQHHVGRTAEVVRALPNVLEIYTRNAAETDLNVLEESGSGSGVVVDKHGYIITCNHVVVGVAEVTVKIGSERVIAQVIATDVAHDLALVHVDREFTSQITWGDSSTLLPGDFVFAIGYPFDIAELASFGYISQTKWLLDGQACLITDASINPGNSGGGLFDSNGHLVGLPSRTYAAGGIPRNINIAIPGNVAREFVKGNIP